MMIKEWMIKFIASIGVILSGILMLKRSNDKAADAREDKIKREDAEAINESIQEFKEIERNVHEEVNAMSEADVNDDLRRNGWMQDDNK